jgi:hypothetical protein
MADESNDSGLELAADPVALRAPKAPPTRPEQLVCPHCQLAMHPAVGHLQEAACHRCQARYLGADAAGEIILRYAQVTPETLRVLMGHFAGKFLACPQCQRRMRQVKLRGVPLEIC